MTLLLPVGVLRPGRVTSRDTGRVEANVERRASGSFRMGPFAVVVEDIDNGRLRDVERPETPRHRSASPGRIPLRR